MPEFILDTSGRVQITNVPFQGATLAYSNLDAFTQGYIEALFFTESSPAYDSEEWFSAECVEAQEEGQADGTIPGDVGFGDLAPEALAEILKDCATFQSAYYDLLTEAFALDDSYSESQAGHDYWLTRNGHGAGFWDRGLGKIGDELSDACRHSTVDVYFGDDRKVYV